MTLLLVKLEDTDMIFKKFNSFALNSFQFTLVKHMYTLKKQTSQFTHFTSNTLEIQNHLSYTIP